MHSFKCNNLVFCLFLKLGMPAKGVTSVRWYLRKLSRITGMEPKEQNLTQMKTRRPEVNLLEHSDINYQDLQDFKNTFNNTPL